MVSVRTPVRPYATTLNLAWWVTLKSPDFYVFQVQNINLVFQYFYPEVFCICFKKTIFWTGKYFFKSILPKSALLHLLLMPRFFFRPVIPCPGLKMGFQRRQESLLLPYILFYKQLLLQGCCGEGYR